MKLNLQELAAVLAGLRLVQQRLRPVPGGVNVDDILTGGGMFRPLSVEQINQLCEEINVRSHVEV